MGKRKRLFTRIIVCVVLVAMIVTGVLVIVRAEEPANAGGFQITHKEQEAAEDAIEAEPAKSMAEDHAVEATDAAAPEIGETTSEDSVVESDDEAAADITATAAVAEPVPEISLDGAVEILLSDGQAEVSRDGAVLSLALAQEAGVRLEDNTLQLSEAGTYVLSGTLQGGIEVTSSKKKEVTLVLNGLTVENPDGAAIDVRKTGSLVVWLQDGTENVLTSGTETEIDDTSAEAAADASGGALYSKANTWITGNGSLSVNGYINNGIQCTKDLTIESGTMQIKALNHGIKGKGLVCVNSGNLTVLAGNDGIHAEQEAQEAVEEVLNAETGEVITEAQEEEEAAGEIILNGGTIDIDCYGDAMQALLALTVNDGTITLKTEGEYPNANSQGDFGWGRPGAGWDYTDTVSEKGLKTDGELIINGGIITIDSVDDALHSAGLLTVNGGNLQIRTGDDGIHSDIEIQIKDGTVVILTSYEGVEANQITVSGGTVWLYATDDGFNANGGSDSFGGPGGSRGAEVKSTETPNLNISGGTIYVDSVGDGLDSNGNITVSGGYVVVDGPESDWNGPIDGGTENGGVISVTGGTVWAGGASGMAETFAGSSSQYSFLCTLPAAYATGTEIRVLDAEGNELFRHTTASRGNSVVFSSPELAKDETYTLYVGENAYEITISSISTSVRASSNGTMQSGGQGQSQGGPGGGPRR